MNNPFYMNRVFLLRQSCGEVNRRPLMDCDKKGQTCVLPTPLTTVGTLLWPVPSFLLGIIVQNTNKTRTMFPASPPTPPPPPPPKKIAMELSILRTMRKRLDVDVLTGILCSTPTLCLSRLWTSGGWTLGFSAATLSAGEPIAVISTEGLHWRQAELKSLPFPFMTETRTEREIC